MCYLVWIGTGIILLPDGGHSIYLQQGSPSVHCLKTFENLVIDLGHYLFLAQLLNMSYDCGVL